MRYRPFAAALCIALGCSDDESSGLPCHITDPACQERVYYETTRLRDQSTAERPDVRVIELEQLEKEFREDAPAEDDASRAWTRAFRLMGMLEPDTPPIDVALDEFLKNVAAYYDSSTQRVTILDRGGRTDPVDDVFVLSHEFAHALQDEDPGLGRFYDAFAASTDSTVAVDALVEGEATVLSLALIAPLFEVRSQSVDFDAYGEDLIDSALAAVADASSPLTSALLVLPYGLGAPSVGAVWAEEGARAARALYEKPLLTARAWLDAFESDPLECFPTAAPESYTGFDHDQLGIAGVLAFLVATGMPATDAWEAAAAWRDDRLVLFTDAGAQTDADPGVAVAWRIRWSDADAAKAFAKRADELPAGADVAVVEREVLLRLSEEDATWSEPACGDESELPVLEDAEEAPKSTLVGWLRRRGARTR